VIAHGSPDEMAHAKKIINYTKPEALDEHQPSCANTEACLVEA
jgi:hypothetical protein